MRHTTVTAKYRLLRYNWGMNKRARSYRLHPTALEHLAVLQALTGSTQASLIEQALAVYRAFLQDGVRPAADRVRHEVAGSEVESVEPAAVDAELSKNERGKTPKPRTRKKPVVVKAAGEYGPLFEG